MLTLTRVPLVMVGCFASIAVIVTGCGNSSTDTANGGGTTGSSSGATTSAPTTSNGTTSATTTDAGTTDGTASSTAADETTEGTTAIPTSGTTDTSGSPGECGNGVVEAGEACDDGNLVDGDGCESDCEVGELLCGNGLIDPGETCDDGNGAADDGCGTSCVTECGYLCLEVGKPCIPGFHAVQCASPGPPFGQASPIGNDCQLATLSVDGSHIMLSPATTIDGEPRHLDAMYTDPSNAVFGFAGDTEDIAAGSRLVAVNTATGELTPVGPSLGVWIMGAAMNDDGELWVTVFDTYERNETTEVRIAQADPDSGEFIDGPTLLTEGNMPVTVWSTHVSDVAFRFDGAMFLSANEPDPPPPDPLSRYLEVDRATATVLASVEGPDDLYAAGIVFVGEEAQIIAMDIRGEDDIFILDLSAPPTLNETLLYADPIMTNSGTADLAGCSKLEPQ
jgi:cysteine-rich repeat protein